jgi:flagellar secretion chaperone FliS
MSYSHNTRAASAYREREVLNATPGGLVVIVFDHVLVNLVRARAAAAPDKLELRLEALSRARAGIMELLTTLDVAQGGQIGTNLRSLYGFIYTQLMDEARTPEGARLERIVAMVTQLRDAFAKIASDRTSLEPAA